ncbi:MAG TPA: efflux RND transporter periplasmic adaptor subunit [Limnobacter sp.]|nr:efflux RND transporter periplasmic adaptor subunit [Limnobacter sp.]
MTKDPQAQGANKKPLFKRRWVQALLVVAVLGTGVIASEILIATAPTASRKPPERQARLVTTLAVKAGDHAVELLGYGTIQAEQQISFQARVSGTVQEISPKFVPGGTFNKGDVLATLDKTDYEIALQTAQATLAQAQSALLSEQGNQVVAQADFDLLGMNVNEREKALILRQPQLAAAKANVQSAQAAVAQARVNLDRTVLRAPFDGVVVSREASAGAQVSANTTLGQLASSQNFWVIAGIPQVDLQWIRFPASGQSGSRACVSDASRTDAQCHPGRVLSLQSSVQDNGRQAQVLVEVPRSKKPGLQPLLLAQYVKVRFEGITVPNAFKLDPAHVRGNTVWVNQQGELDVREVQVLFRSAEYVLVGEGLKDGDEIITSNLGAAVDGMAIRTAEQAPAKP